MSKLTFEAEPYKSVFVLFLYQKRGAEGFPLIRPPFPIPQRIGQWSKAMIYENRLRLLMKLQWINLHVWIENISCSFLDLILLRIICMNSMNTNQQRRQFDKKSKTFFLLHLKTNIEWFPVCICSQCSLNERYTVSLQSGGYYYSMMEIFCPWDCLVLFFCFRSEEWISPRRKKKVRYSMVHMVWYQQVPVWRCCMYVQTRRQKSQARGAIAQNLARRMMRLISWFDK